MVSVDEVALRLSGFKDALSYEKTDTFIVVRAIKWISTEDYAKISTLIKEFNGERIRAGKESHWRIPVSTVKTGSLMKDRLLQLRSELDKIIEEMK